MKDQVHELPQFEISSVDELGFDNTYTIIVNGKMGQTKLILDFAEKDLILVFKPNTSETTEVISCEWADFEQFIDCIEVGMEEPELLEELYCAAELMLEIAAR